MGSLSSVVAPIANIGVKTIASAGQYFLSNSERLRDLDALNAKNAQLKQSAALQKQSNLLALQQKETDRLSKLRHALSTQRANFGGKGIGSVTGSSDSVFQGLNETSDIERQNNRSKTIMDNTIIDQNLKHQTQLNLLQKQQLKQKTAMGFITDLMG